MSLFTLNPMMIDMTIEQAYRMVQAAKPEQPSFDYPLWEKHLEEDIQGIFDRRLEYEEE